MSSARISRRSASGRWRSSQGVAYGQPFETATAAVRLDGEGVRLDSLQIVQAGGRALGAAWVGLNGTYSFNLDGRGIPLSGIAMLTSRVDAAALGPSRLHCGRQRDVRPPALRRARDHERRVRRRRRRRSGGRRHEHQRRPDDAEGRGRVAAPRGLGRRPDRADRHDGRRAVVQRRRYVARSVHPRVQPATVAVHHRDRQRQRARGRSARERRRAARRGDRSSGSICGCSTTGCGTRRQSAWRSIATRRASPRCGWSATRRSSTSKG